MWSTVEDLSPDVWLWMGDVVYVDMQEDGKLDAQSHGSIEKMKEAYAQQLANRDYQRFLGKVPRVEGVWDDHDFGVNDVGKRLSDHPGRVAVFLDFLGVGPEDPRRGGATLYASHVFGEAPKQVKVITLDLRTQRDDYYAFNIAHRRFKFASTLGAFSRLFSSMICLGSEYDGSMMAEDQWQWLEGQLRDSEAAVHVLVSSLQVMTSNPLVESWGHFPHSRRRLLELLHRTNPSGLVILSGDVHHAELSSGWRARTPPSPEGGGNLDAKKTPSDADCAAHSAAGRGNGAAKGESNRGVVEVTTSGMTHSCLSSHGRWMCAGCLDRWNQHRWRDDTYYLDTNFGDIEIEWAEGKAAPQPARMTVTVRDTNGTAILPIVDHFGGGKEPADIQSAQQQRQQQHQPERTFLDRSPPPECVEPVLPGGCTARMFSALAAFVIALVATCTGLLCGTPLLFGGAKNGRIKHKSSPAGENGSRIVPENGSRKGPHRVP
ncbi:unnamed protein product [Ascophyllum nodosum]